MFNPLKIYKFQSSIYKTRNLNSKKISLIIYYFEIYKFIDDKIMLIKYRLYNMFK